MSGFANKRQKQQDDKCIKKCRQQDKSRYNRSLANSQFIKEKLQLEYTPIIHIIKTEKILSNQQSSKRKYELDKLRTENKTFQQMKEQIKNGRGIIIDWSTKSKYRTTKLPNVTTIRNSQRLQSYYSKNSKMSQINSLGMSQYLKKQISSQNIRKNKIKQKDKDDSQIFAKSQHLQQLLTYHEASKNPKQLHKYKKPKMRLRIKTDNQISKEDNPFVFQGFKTTTTKILQKEGSTQSIRQKIKKRQKLFFQANHQRLKLAMKQQDRILTQSVTIVKDIIHTSMPPKQKKKINQIQQRIRAKSKLTLLKSDLLRKYKQIRESILEQQQSKYKDFSQNVI